MAALVCDLCGGKLIMGTGGIATCESCGMEHSADRMKEKVQEIKGTVRIDNTHMIDNYLEMANNAYSSNNNSETESYCNKIIEIDPRNYKAWLLKGKSAGWQSTLANSRIAESVSAFAKAIINAPEEEKEYITEDAKDQIKRLCIAMVSLQTERFTKWPDEEETLSCVSLVNSILSTVVDFLAQTGTLITLNEIMSPVATLINQSVVEAYQKVIYPDYKSDRYPYPDKDDWQKYLVRITCCEELVKKAISLCKPDDENDIQMYENLIYLDKQALESRSYNSEYFDFDRGNGSWFVKRMEQEARSRGLIPDSANNRVYYEECRLNNQMQAKKSNEIQEYETKIKELKAAKTAKEAAEKAEREQIAKEEAQKRFDAYWAGHTEEKAALEAERNELNSQISVLTASQNDQVVALNKEIADIPEKAEIDNLKERIKTLSDKRSTLGLFKGKEKKAIQEQIDQAYTEKKRVEDRMDAAKKEIESKIASVKADFQKKISPLQNRVNTISNELTKAR